MRWTRPFHGVMHLEGVRHPYQVTVTNYATFSECWVKAREGFLPDPPNEQTFPTEAEAKAWGEARAKALGLI